MLAAACILAALVLIAAGFRLLLRHLDRQRERRVQEAVRQRTQAARELQDTLLQNFQGVLLKFHAATALVLTRPEEARSKLNEALIQADQTITEARDAMQGLRPGPPDLAENLTQLGAELGADPADEDAPTFGVEVHGERRSLSPVVRDEVQRVGRDAVRAAFARSGVERIEVHIHYGARKFELRVWDNGRVDDTEAHGAEDQRGGFSVREEPWRAGGHLSVRRRAGAGTDVHLAIPAPAAYESLSR